MKSKKILTIAPTFLLFTFLIGCNGGNTPTSKTVDKIETKLKDGVQNSFKVGQSIAKTDFIVTATYSDKTTGNVTDWTSDEFAKDATYTFKDSDAPSKTFNFKYKEKTSTFNITVVKESKSTIKANLKEDFECKDGYAITKDDIVVKEVKEDKSEVDVPSSKWTCDLIGEDGYTFTHEDAEAKTKEFTINYSQLSCKLTVDVVALLEGEVTPEMWNKAFNAVIKLNANSNFVLINEKKGYSTQTDTINVIGLQTQIKNEAFTLVTNYYSNIDDLGFYYIQLVDSKWIKYYSMDTYGNNVEYYEKSYTGDIKKQIDKISEFTFDASNKKYIKEAKSEYDTKYEVYFDVDKDYNASLNKMVSNNSMMGTTYTWSFKYGEAKLDEPPTHVNEIKFTQNEQELKLVSDSITYVGNRDSRYFVVKVSDIKFFDSTDTTFKIKLIDSNGTTLVPNQNYTINLYHKNKDGVFHTVSVGEETGLIIENDGYAADIGLTNKDYLSITVTKDLADTNSHAEVVFNSAE